MSKRFQTVRRGDDDIDQQRDAQAAGGKRLDRLRRDFLVGLPVAEFQSLQLGPGTGEYVSRRVCGRDPGITSYKVEPGLAVHTVLN